MILHSQVALKIHVSQPLWPSVSKLWLSSSLTVMGVNDCLLWLHQQSWSRGSKLECRQRWNKYIYSGPVCWGWGLHESDLFQHIRQILDKYEIWRFWRPGWQCELLVMSLESFLSSFWGVAAATGDGASGPQWCLEGRCMSRGIDIHINARNQDFWQTIAL